MLEGNLSLHSSQILILALEDEWDKPAVVEKKERNTNMISEPCKVCIFAFRSRFPQIDKQNCVLERRHHFYL